MKKLKLNLDDLKVESFATTSEATGLPKGTVRGYDPCTEQISCDDVTCGSITCAPGPGPGTCLAPTSADSCSPTGEGCAETWGCGGGGLPTAGICTHQPGCELHTEGSCPF